LQSKDDSDDSSDESDEEPPQKKLKVLISMFAFPSGDSDSYDLFLSVCRILLLVLPSQPLSLPRKQGIVMMTVLKKALVAMRKMTNRYQ
jgi:hypothetical protein